METVPCFLAICWWLLVFIQPGRRHIVRRRQSFNLRRGEAKIRMTARQWPNTDTTGSDLLPSLTTKFGHQKGLSFFSISAILSREIPLRSRTIMPEIINIQGTWPLPRVRARVVSLHTSTLNLIRPLFPQPPAKPLCIHRPKGRVSAQLRNESQLTYVNI